MKSMTEILEPIWNFGFWTCHGRSYRGKCSRIFNGVGVFISVVILALSAVYEMFQLTKDFLDRPSLRAVIYSLIGSFIQTTSFIFSVYMLARRKKFLELFELWNQLEHRPLIRNHWRMDKRPTLTLVSSILIAITLVAMVLIYPDAPMLISQNQKLVNIFTKPLLATIQCRPTDLRAVERL